MSYKNFNHVTHLKCRNCKSHDALYDAHHDEIFCRVCGNVIKQNGRFVK